MRKENPDIRAYILKHVENNPADIGRMTMDTFGVSRTTISNYMKKMVAEGMLEASGNTKARTYKLKPLVEESFRIDLFFGLAEDAIWRFRIAPLMEGLPQNIINLCQFSFTEMLNNAIDHSVSDQALIGYQQYPNHIELLIADQGVGIFNKIKTHFGLQDARIALLELSKGKLTSDTANHSGQGIFFTSRMMDTFSILSGHLFYNREQDGAGEWLIEIQEKEAHTRGTTIKMTISLASDKTVQSVFQECQGDDFSFRKTHVPLKLGQYPGEQLVSRSQAKRVLARFENFSEVLLDFDEVEMIGQAFADEIFRVFQNQHPDIHIHCIHTNQTIDKVIKFVRTYHSDTHKE